MKKTGVILLIAANLFVALVFLLLARYFHSFTFPFSITYTLLFIPVSYLAYRALLENTPIFLKNLKRDLSLVVGASLALYLATVVLSSVTLGSIYITLTIGVITAFAVFTLFKDKVIINEELKDTTKPYRHLLSVFFLAYAVRALVLGTSTIPLGYDTPGYLRDALDGSKLGWQEMIGKTIHLSSNVYIDTYNFSKVWLGISYKFLALFGLEPEYISKLIIPLISSLSTIPVFLLAREFTQNNKASIFASLTFALMPSELIFGGFYKEILGEFFLILSLYLMVKYLKDTSLPNLALLLLSLAFLWKSAVTASAKFVLFGFPIFLFSLRSKDFGAERSRRVLILPLLAIVAFLLLQDRMLATFPQLSPELLPHGFFPSHRFSFVLISSVDLIPFAIFLFYFARVYLGEGITRAEKSALSVASILFLSLFFYSFILAALGNYKVFPSTPFRFSLYLGLPYSLAGGLFLHRVTATERTRKTHAAALVLLSLLAASALTGHTGTTPAPGQLGRTVPESVYEELDSMDYSGYSGVVVLGEFRPSPASFKRWVNFLVLKNSGKRPVFIEDYSEIEKLNLENQSYLFLNLSGKKVSDIRAL